MNPRPASAGPAKTVHDFSATTIDGVEQTLGAYRGKTLLIVNVASRCVFTPQYAGLEALYRKYRDRGFLVLGFPCDQFAHQEPLDEAQIQSFCSRRYDVTFPMFAKIDVNGSRAHPLYEHLKHAARGLLGTGAIKWNFTKFLVDGNGRVLRRYGPRERPDEIEAEIDAVLARR